MKPDKMIDIINHTLDDFPEVRFSTLFGSAAQNRLTANSDIDIAVAAQQKLTPEYKVRLSQTLSSALKREVDLVDLQDVSGLILEQALCKAVIVKNHDHELYARLLKRLWYNQADMMPYVKQIFEQRAKTLLSTENTEITEVEPKEGA